ncbi:hypothetical protein [Mucilaginibacter flavidus]|uniref:hypothetical protein n=1 Tax=Mucilaginibacter flavidus TaxID=2949309 RepID=UPI002093123F|nr:hypothetical protein [Mucilaginibacter flavidus]MCO5950709.1 hypothetical protein [Mucilaginibacter flavidus]
MESVVISGNSNNVRLLSVIAQKVGLSVKHLTKDDIEDFVMAKCIEEGATGQLIDIDDFLNSL